MLTGSPIGIQYDGHTPTTYLGRTPQKDLDIAKVSKRAGCCGDFKGSTTARPAGHAPLTSGPASQKNRPCRGFPRRSETRLPVPLRKASCGPGDERTQRKLQNKDGQNQGEKAQQELGEQRVFGKTPERPHLRHEGCEHHEQNASEAVPELRMAYAENDVLTERWVAVEQSRDELVEEQC